MPPEGLQAAFDRGGGHLAAFQL